MKQFSDSIILSNGVSIPGMGFGTWRLPDAPSTVEVILDAIDIGFRHIDTAAFYQNERSVGEAVRRAKAARSELFVTTKLWNDSHGYDTSLCAFDASLSRLGLDYVDLYLIHWPIPKVERDHYPNNIRETWRALEEIYASGRARAIGVSNFLPHHLDALLQSAKITPMVNQIECHPGYLQAEVVAYCRAHHIAVEAWSPLGAGRILELPILVSLAAKYQKSPAQICLRWLAQKDIIALPKSKSRKRTLSNTQIFDFCLEPEDAARLDALSVAGWSGEDPDHIDF